VFFVGKEVAAHFGVGATEVEGEVIAFVFEEANGGEVVGEDVVVCVGRCVETTVCFDNVDAKRMLVLHVGETLCNGFSAVVLQAIVNNNGLILWQSKEAWFGVAVGVLGRDGAYFDVTKSE